MVQVSQRPKDWPYLTMTFSFVCNSHTPIPVATVSLRPHILILSSSWGLKSNKGILLECKLLKHSRSIKWKKTLLNYQEQTTLASYVYASNENWIAMKKNKLLLQGPKEIVQPCCASMKVSVCISSIHITVKVGGCL